MNVKRITIEEVKNYTPKVGEIYEKEYLLKHKTGVYAVGIYDKENSSFNLTPKGKVDLHNIAEIYKICEDEKEANTKLTQVRICAHCKKQIQIGSRYLSFCSNGCPKDNAHEYEDIIVQTYRTTTIFEGECLASELIKNGNLEE